MAGCRSRFAEFQQTWHTHPCRSVLCGLSPFQVCIVSTDLEHLPLPERSLRPLPVPGLRSFGRLGTLTFARGFSMAGCRSRFVRIVQTWNGDMPQEYFKAGVVFQVCQNCADLERVVFLYSGICSIIP